VLPDGYTKIRHYGLLAPGNVNTKLARARELIERDSPPPPMAPGNGIAAQPSAAATAPQHDGTADDLAQPTLRCPNCAGTTFSLIATLPSERRRRMHPPPDT